MLHGTVLNYFGWRDSFCSRWAQLSFNISILIQQLAYHADVELELELLMIS